MEHDVLHHDVAHSLDRVGYPPEKRRNAVLVSALRVGLAELLDSPRLHASCHTSAATQAGVRPLGPEVVSTGHGRSRSVPPVQGGSLGHQL